MCDELTGRRAVRAGQSTIPADVLAELGQLRERQAALRAAVAVSPMGAWRFGRARAEQDLADADVLTALIRYAVEGKPGAVHDLAVELVADLPDREALDMLDSLQTAAELVAETIGKITAGRRA